MAIQNICQISGCINKTKNKTIGLCRKHYDFQRYRAICKVEGCDRFVDSIGLCKTHCKRQRKYGDPGVAAIKARTQRSCRQTDHPLYGLWKNIIKRCYSLNHHCYHKYGERGIRVCDRWRHSFWNFVDDVGERPSLKHSIDRYPDNYGDYQPDNFRWATVAEQARNRRDNRRITINGQTKIVTDWAKEIGVLPSLIFSRIKNGWTEEQAVTIPTLKRSREQLGK